MSKSISKDVHCELVNRATNIEVGLVLSREQSRAERKAAFFAAVEAASKNRREMDKRHAQLSLHAQDSCYA